MIRLSRSAITIFTLAFGLYHGVLGLMNLGHHSNPNFLIFAVVSYFVALGVSIADSPGLYLKDYKAAFTLVVASLISLAMAASVAEGHVDNHTTWHVAGVATLMAILALRQHKVMAWFGVLVMTAEVLFWGGFDLLFNAGIFGALMLVAAAHAASNTLGATSRAAMDYREQASETAAATAAQSAARNERQLRVEKALSAALPLLRAIESSSGILSDKQKLEALQLEATLRDQIRGRHFDSAVLLAEISKARSRGVDVKVLDDGGLEHLSEVERDRILSEAAQHVAKVQSGKILLRSVANEPWVVSITASRAGSEVPDLFVRI